MSAAVVQAASVAWTITGVNGPDGSALGTGHAYVFFVAQDSGKADTSAWSGLQGKGATELIAAVASANFDYTHSDITADAGAWSYNATTAGSVKTNGDLGLAGNTKYSAYAVIFDTETITDSSKFMVTTAANAAATYGDSAGTTRTFVIGGQGTASGSWYAVNVPEPTSGLLMLLGMAGLALRRKRA